MKGGIASGVVFPEAVAERENLPVPVTGQNVGRSDCSRRRSGGRVRATNATAPDGTVASHGWHRFDLIAQVPEVLAGPAAGGQSRLLSLFQPAPSVRRLFKVALAALPRAIVTGPQGDDLIQDGRAARVGRVIVTLAREFPLVWLGWAVVSVLLVLLVASPGFGLASVLGTIGCLLLALVVAVLVVAALLLRMALIDVPARRATVCAPGDANPAAETAPWWNGCTSFVQEAAGRASSDDPLAFGDLWTLGKSRGGASETAKRAIDLVLMTTNLTQGLSHRLPFIEKSSREPLYFRPRDLERVLPTTVVQWMVDHENPAEVPGMAVDAGKCCRLPLPENIPVLFGARISLSFPILLQAVPLFAVNPELAPPDGSSDKPRRIYGLVPCWFSDGGITSNFPVHLFDAPLPTRPTFCINLVPEAVRIVGQPQAQERPPVGSARDWVHVTMASTNGERQRARLTQFDVAPDATQEGHSLPGVSWRHAGHRARVPG